MRYLFMCILFLLLSDIAYASACAECHGSPPSDRSHAVHSGLDEMQSSYGDTGYTSQYLTGASQYGFNCGNCHPADSGEHKNGMIDVEISMLDDDSLRALNDENAVYDGEKKRCFGVYCHSGGRREGTIAYITSPRWNREEKGSRCHECHDSPPTYKSTRQRANGHFNPSRGSGHLLGIHWDAVNGHSKESFTHDSATQMGCSTCHYDTVRNDTDTAFVDTVNGLFTCVRCHELRDGDIFDYSLHINGQVDITFAPVNVRSRAQLISTPEGWIRKGRRGLAGSYDEAEDSLSSVVYNNVEQSCANVSCHLGAETVFWDDAVGCGDCHTDIIDKMRHTEK